MSPKQGLIPVKPRKATPGGHSTEPKLPKLHHSSDINGLIWVKNIAKGTTDPRVEFISQIITQTLIKQFQNFDKALTSKS